MSHSKPVSPVIARLLWVVLLTFAGLALPACPGPQPIATQPTVVKLALDKPHNSTMSTTHLRRQYQIRVQKKGVLRLKLSWNNPTGFVRFVFRTQAHTDSLDASARQELLKDQEVTPGIYYVELVGSGQDTSFNLLATMVENTPK